jgi:hypothetical protein
MKNPTSNRMPYKIGLDALPPPEATFRVKARAIGTILNSVDSEAQVAN